MPGDGPTPDDDRGAGSGDGRDLRPMSEAARHSRGTTGDESPIDVSPGRQILLSLSPMESALGLLPAGAYENLLIVSVGDDPDAVERRIAERGHDPGNVGVVPVSATPVSLGDEAWTSPRVSPGDLTGISIGIAQGMQYLRADEGWFLFDDFGVLCMHADPSRVCQLIGTLASKCRSRNVTGVYGMVPEAVENSTAAQVSSLLDEAVESA